jgi:hypothetical protein
MRSVDFGFGGNKPFYDILVEYQVEKEPISKKYASKAAQYYKRRQNALVDGVEFKEEKPAKNFQETLDRTKATLTVYGGHAQKHAAVAGQQASEKASQLKQKIIE